MPTESHTLLLCSASPRRRRLLELCGVRYRISSVDLDEDLTRPLPPDVLARTIAGEKAAAARGTAEPGEVVVTFDTIVVLDGRVLGKPRDLDDARRMLRALSGRTHQVVTGVALLQGGESEPRTFAVVSDVRMRELSEADIAAWAAKGELLGCAGAYNIESHLASVEPTECFQNVAGLPLCHLWRSLTSGELGEIEGLVPPCAGCEEARGTVCELGRRLVEGEGR